MFTIWTDKFGEFKPWEPFGELWQTDSPVLAMRQLAYFRFAYPDNSHSLQRFGWIVSTEELSELARFLILDD